MCWYHLYRQVSFWSPTSIAVNICLLFFLRSFFTPRGVHHLSSLTPQVMQPAAQLGVKTFTRLIHPTQWLMAQLGGALITHNQTDQVSDQDRALSLFNIWQYEEWSMEPLCNLLGLSEQLKSNDEHSACECTGHVNAGQTGYDEFSLRHSGAELRQREMPPGLPYAWLPCSATAMGSQGMLLAMGTGNITEIQVERSLVERRQGKEKPR